MDTIRGVLPALLTPFDDHGALHERALRSHLEFLLEKGVDGVYACGTFGSGPLLSMSEHTHFMNILVNTVSQRVPVIVHVGRTTAAESVELAKAAADAGVDAVASIPPYYYPHSAESILFFYDRLISQSELPVFVYNMPPRVGYGLAPEILAQVADMGAVGMKDSSNDIKIMTQFMNAVKRPGFQFIVGAVPMFYSALAMGVVAGVSGPANVFPEVHHELFREYEKRNLDRCAEIQRRLMRLVQIQNTGGVPYTSLIAMLDVRGVSYGGHPHEPLQHVSASTKQTIERQLKEEGFM